jgi:TatD DNase family protein
MDTHAHLDDKAFDKDRAAVISRCAAASLGLVTIGTSVTSSREALRLAQRHRGMWATVGVHPHNATSLSDAALRELRDLASCELVVGIGEIGLDYYRDLSPRPRQRDAFRAQLDLAAEFDLPICIHNRESTSDLLAILREVENVRGVVHSFLGDGELATEFLSLGFYLGIGGPLTFPKNGALRDAVKSSPLDRIVLETDCPYLTPVPYRGRRNEPVYVTYVAETIADLRGIDLDDVARQTTENAVRLFGLTAGTDS